MKYLSYFAGVAFGIGIMTILAVVIAAFAGSDGFNVTLLYNAVISFIVGFLCLKVRDALAKC